MNTFSAITGAFPSAGFGYAAYIRDMLYFDNNDAQFSAYGPSSGNFSIQDASCYGGLGPYADGTSPTSNNIFGSWWNYFFYGGPGLGAPGCN